MNGQAEELLIHSTNSEYAKHCDRWWRYNKEHDHHGISVKEQLQ